jgi:hypothetical protein
LLAGHSFNIVHTAARDSSHRYLNTMAPGYNLELILEINIDVL